MTPKATPPSGRATRSQAGSGTAARSQAGSGTAPRSQAGSGTAARSQAGSRAGSTAHRRAIRQQPAPRAPRRVSGPTGGRMAAAAAAGAAAPRMNGGGVALPLPRFRPRRAPGREAPRRSRTGANGARAGVLLGARAARFVRALPDHRVLDRVVRGRAWILILGVMLAGIVAMQVEVLKLGASIGRSIQQTTALQSRNELLRASVASLADDQRIERMAAGMGMVMPPPTGVDFLKIRHSDLRHALGGIHAPDATTFLTALAASEAPPAQPISSSAATGTSPTGAMPLGAGTPAASSGTGAGTTTPSSTGTSPSATPTVPSSTPTTSPTGAGTTGEPTGAGSGASAPTGTAATGTAPTGAAPTGAATGTPIAPAGTTQGTTTTGGASPTGG